MNAEAQQTSNELEQATVLSQQLEPVTTALAQIDKVGAGISALRAKYANVVFDVTSTKGMKEACEARAEIREPRYEVERLRKAAKRPILDLGKKLDSEAERITNELLALEGPVDNAIKAEERRKEDEKRAKADIERKRVAAIRERIDEIRQRPADAAGQSSAEIDLYVRALESLQIDESFAEFKQEAEGAKATALVRLRSAHAKQVALEAEQQRLAEDRARLERERAEEEARQAQERARIAEEERQAKAAREAEEARAREAREAEERRLAAERQKLAEAQRQAESARKAEEERLTTARQAAEELAAAERARLAAERAEAERQEAVRREALAAEEQRIADERAQLEREREEQRMREAGSESDMANTLTEPPVQTGAESSAVAASEPEATSLQGFIDIVFDGPPHATSGRFVEVEDHTGKSISIGEWVQRPDTYWVLRVAAAELGIVPSAWMRGVTSPGGPWGPAEHDVECYAGDEPPDNNPEWIPLYRKISEGAA